MAVRNSDDLAEALGIDLMRTRTLSFVLSVVYAGFAGALYAGQVRFLGPDLGERGRDLRPRRCSCWSAASGTLARARCSGTFIVTWLTQSLQFLQDYRMSGVRPGPDRC